MEEGRSRGLLQRFWLLRKMVLYFFFMHIEVTVAILLAFSRRDVSHIG